MDEKVAHVSNLSGGSPAEVLVVLSLLISGFNLYRAFSLVLGQRSGTVRLALEVLFFPLWLCVACTVGSSFVLYLVGLGFVVPWAIFAALREEAARHEGNLSAYLNVFRAGMMLATCMSILAVDFDVFPRRFAKTETFGFSLMDVGVGSFVLSSGLVRRSQPLGRAVADAVKIGGLGLVRLLVTTAAEYPQHVSEYGTHWNFFLTLAIIIFVSGALGLPHWPAPAAAGLALSMVVQGFLLWPNVTPYVLEAERTTFFSHNREGLISLAGFVAIFLCALQVGHSLRAWTTCRAKVSGLLRWAALSALLSCAAHLYVQPISRRLANLAYVGFVVGLNCFVLAGLVAVDYHTSAPKAEVGRVRLLEAVSRNQLLCFLGSNLLTGAVNLSINTLECSDAEAMAVLLTYSVVVSLGSLVVDRLMKKPQRN